MNQITKTFSFPNLSRRNFIMIGGKMLALDVAGILLTHSDNSNPIKNNYCPTKDANIKPFTIGFIGKPCDFKFYADVFKAIPTVSFNVIDKEFASQKQTEAVIIAVPLKERAELTKNILKAGCHVLVEMPMATSYEEFDVIIEQANQQNKRLGIISFHRFLTSAIQAQRWIDNIGKINQVQIQVKNKISDPFLLRYQDSFIGKGLPLLELVRWILAKSSLNLYTYENPLAQFHQPTKNLHLSIKLGRIPLLYSTVPSILSDPLAEWMIIIYGKKGYLKLSSTNGLQHINADGKTVLAEQPLNYKEAVHELLTDFIEACQTGREPEVNALDSLAGTAFTLAAVQSAQNGQATLMVEQPYGTKKNKVWLQKYYQRLRKEKEEKQKKQGNKKEDKEIDDKVSRLMKIDEKYQQQIPMKPTSLICLNGLNPLEIADRIAQRVMTRHKIYPSYSIDLALEGLLYLFDASNQQEYLNHVLKVWQFRAKKNSETLDWKMLFVCLHFETFLRTGNTAYIETFVKVATDFRENIPRDFEGAVAQWVRPKKTRIFIDMLQGYAIFMARAGWLSGDETFFDECVNQYQLFRNILRNPQTGLWHQGRGWGPELHTISPGHWNRGQGWVFRGMVESLCYLPENYSKQPLMLAMMKEFAESLKTYQDSRGMWHQLTDHPEAYQETSGTALFVHYFYKAIQNGWLPKKTFLPVAEKGLKGLLGFVHKNGLVSNTSQGSGPLMTLEGYLHRPSVPGEPHSIGTTLMACAAPYLSEIHPRFNAGTNHSNCSITEKG